MAPSPDRAARDPIRPPELGELETLVACATDGSFAGAASRLGISRPAVTKRIANLEALAGRPLLHRSPAGVSLTDSGAAVLAGARRMLEERDVLFGVLSELRSQAPSSIAGLRRLLGDGDLAARSAHLAETRLADTQRLLDLILRSTASGVAITDLETGVVHEANEAFCRFTGRSREELLGQRAPVETDCYEEPHRQQMIDKIRRSGAVTGVPFRMQCPDGSIRNGRATTYLVSVAGEAVLLSIVDGVAEQPAQAATRGNGRTAVPA